MYSFLQNNFKHLIIFMATLFCCQTLKAICIFSPHENIPYFEIVESMIQGFKETIPTAQVLYKMEINLCEDTENSVILLGPDVYKQMKEQLRHQPNIVVAADPDQNPRVSDWVRYIPDPRAMFEKIDLIEQQIETVHIVVGPNHDEHHVQKIKEYFEKSTKTLQVHNIVSAKEAPDIFNKIILDLDATRDVLWISPHHGQYNIGALVPALIKKSLYGKKRIIGNNLSWVDKGLYLGTFPNNRLLGHELARIALSAESNAITSDVENKHQLPNIYYLESLQLVVNTKTIRFIGSDVSNNERELIDLLLPRN